MKSAKENFEIMTGEGDHFFYFRCFGVTVCVCSNSLVVLQDFVKQLPQILPVKWRRLNGRGIAAVAHTFIIISTSNGVTIYKNEEVLARNAATESWLEILQSHLRLTIAEYARNFVFLHAGAVSWKGQAVIIPGKTFTGKTTLVSELIKLKCGYLSDEYAVIDKNGLVYPFPKKLSLRGIIDDFRQVDFGVEELGGKHRRSPVPIGYLLISEYQKNNAPPPHLETATIGEGIMASVANSISVRQNPKFVLEVLSRSLEQAKVFRTKRGEAAEFAAFFLRHIQNRKDSENLR